jgi:P pilus assembly chaperone PapD
MTMIRSFGSALGVTALAVLAPLAAVAPARAAGDLLVAPTRVVLDGARGTEVIVNNIGSEVATYRISLVIRRMKQDGSFEEVEDSAANEREAKTLAMISYAPRRVTLPPNQPQAIRVGVRPPEGLADGEYRAHLLIRAIPDAKTPTQTANAGQGLTISITPIYGITIPVIVRKGQLVAQAAILDPQIVQTPDGPAFKIKLSRSGTKSTYGRIRVTRPGVSDPLYEARGIAVYAETAQRDVILPIPVELATKLKGPATVEYLEDNPSDGGVIASFKGVIR